jgi:hypothetical protein
MALAGLVLLRVVVVVGLFLAWHSSSNSILWGSKDLLQA